MIVDPVNGRVEPYLTRCGDKAFRGLNDLFFASNGDLYFTDQGLSGLHEPNGRLFRLRDNGDLTCLLDNVPSPNGLVMNATETAILLAVTRANAVWRAPFTRDGDLAKVGNFIQLSGGVGPDGLALDVQGRLAIAHPGAGIVWVFDAAGVPIHRVRCCVGNHPTNVAFGGPDNRFLFITETASATIQKAEMDVPGNAMFSA
jgi:gluconolactonase